MALRHTTLLLTVLLAQGAPAYAQAVSKLTSIADWSLYTDEKSPHQFCFLTSPPKSSAPSDLSRDEPRLYISAWPQDGVKNEFSVRLGFPAKKGSDIAAAVGTQSFKMFASDERAYVKDATAELKLVDAMRKGSRLVVTATTATGVDVSDSYSLSGLGQAMGELQSTCF